MTHCFGIIHLNFNWKDLPTNQSPVVAGVAALEMNPQNPVELLIGYDEGSVVLCDVAEQTILQTYELGSNNSTHTTCVCWYADGSKFAVGYSDGSFALWAVRKEKKPFLWRYIDQDTPISLR
jgi:hypothetical protein